MSLIDKNISRRGFLRVSAGAAVAAATLGVSGSASASTKIEGDGAHVVGSDTQILGNVGKWLPIHCNHNCNSMCMNRGYVVDGVCIRQKTDDAHQDTFDRPQQRGCLRGRSLRQQAYNADRIKYPMKRKNWQPGGGKNANGELRGKDEWERISWDEALDYVANELKRVYADYGPRSVICNGWNWPAGSIILKAAGGAIMNSECESFGTWDMMPNALGLFAWNDHPDIMMSNDRHDLENADYIVFYSSNNAWCQTGGAPHFFNHAQEKGVEFVYVGPSRNVTASTYNARWIRVRPGTDTPFLLAVMYEMVRLDKEKGNIIDWDFLRERTVGFDADHMPKNASLDENMLDYIKGEYDGVPKTPEWATEMCGTPVEDITWYAEILAKTNNVMLLHNYGAGRCSGSENVPQAFMTVGAMGGHMGKPGNACGCTYTWDAGDSGPRLVSTDGEYFDKIGMKNPLDPNANIEGMNWWHSLNTGKYISTTEGYFSANNSTPEFHAAREMTCDARLMFSHNSNFMQSRPNLKEAIEVMRKVETCISMEIKMSLTASFSDIILPIATHFEGNDNPADGELCWPNVFGDGNGQKQRKDAVLAYYPLIKPIFEAREDKAVYRDIVERMGMDPEELYPMTNKEQYFNYFLGMKYIDTDMITWKPVITWTEADNQKYGANNPPQQGEITFDQFIENGSWVLERGANDPRNYIGYRDDMHLVDGKVVPAWPRPSTSGKLEIYSQQKADGMNIIGTNPVPIKPYANYFDPKIGYKNTFSDWENKVKGQYPLMAYTPHYMRRAHTCYDNMTWTQEAFRNPVFMNAQGCRKTQY